MKKKISSRKVVAVVAVAVACAATHQGAAQTLKLEEALMRVRGESPALQMARQDVDIQRALGKQSTLYPNPELAVEVENVAGTGEADGFDAAEYTFVVSQAVPLGGQRGQQKRIAKLQAEIAVRGKELTEREVIAEATKSFYDALAAQEHVVLARELEALAGEFVTDAGRRAEAGAASPIEVSKAKIEEAETQLQRSQAEQQYEISMLSLAMHWGASEADFTRLEGTLDDLPEVPPLDELTTGMESHPVVLIFADRKQQKSAELSKARAERFSDVEIGGGVRLEEESGDHSFLFEVAVPLPLWDRNQGERAAAQQDVGRTDVEAQAAGLELIRRLHATYGELSSARSEAKALRVLLLPASQEAYDIARKGYLQGRFGYLDVLDAERTLFEQRTRYIDALLAQRHALAELESLVGPLAKESEETSPEVTQ